MTGLIGKEDATEIARIFSSKLAGRVEVRLFVSKKGADSGPSRKLLEELASLSDRVNLRVFDLDGDHERPHESKVDQTPTTMVMSPKGARLCFVGTPGGRQLKSLVEDIVEVSSGRVEMDRETREIIGQVKTETVIKVFVTPFCTYSPLVVRSAHRFAMENAFVRASMIETLEFPDLVKEYDVVGVPRTVINERLVFDGAPSERAFAEKVLEGSRLPQK